MSGSLDEPGITDPDGLAPRQRPERVTRVVDAMATTEALSVAALAMAAVAIVGRPGQLVAGVLFTGPGDVWMLPVLDALGIAVFAVGGVILAAVARDRADEGSPGWARGIAGAAAILGLVGLVVAVLVVAVTALLLVGGSPPVFG